MGHVSCIMMMFGGNIKRVGLIMVVDCVSRARMKWNGAEWKQRQSV